MITHQRIIDIAMDAVELAILKLQNGKSPDEVRKRIREILENQEGT